MAIKLEEGGGGQGLSGGTFSAAIPPIKYHDNLKEEEEGEKKEGKEKGKEGKEKAKKIQVKAYYKFHLLKKS